MNSRMALLGVGIVFLLAGALAGYLYGVNSTPARTTNTVTTTTMMTTDTVTTTVGVETSTTGTGTSSIDSPGALKLSASVNATNLAVGQSLNVTLSIFNTSPAVNSILPSNDWSFQGVPVALWPPCYGVLPVEVAVLNGNYTAQELPSVANSTFPVECAGYISVDHVIFQPNSGQANLTGIGPGPGLNQTHGPYQLTLSFTTSGYWGLESLSKELNIPIIGDGGSAPSSIAFVPGTYTVAVEDEWGQAVVMHVRVSA
jgi:hypothetical protein